MSAIDLNGLVSVAYFKKAAFTGSFREMRYLLRGGEDEEGNPCIQACHWRGPYASHMIHDEDMICAYFSFDKAGIDAAVRWLNEEYKMYSPSVKGE